MRQLRFCFLSLLLSICFGVSHAAEPAPAGSGFDILEFDIAGNTVLPQSTVEAAVYPHLGFDRGFKDVEAARAALEQNYQDQGFLSVTVLIPEQTLAEGVVRLQVIEGEVERLKVSGNRYFSRSEIREQTPALATGEIPHFPTVQEQLGNLSKTPDRRVTPLLRPGKNPGKLEVELAVEDSLPLHGSLELNNRQSPDTTKQRLEATLRYDNLFQKGHSFGLNFTTSPQKTDEVKVLVASYTAPVADTLSLSAFLQHSDSNINTVSDSSVVGKGNTIGMRLSKNLPGLADAPTFFHSISGGIDYKDFKESQNSLDIDKKDTALSYKPLVLQYTAGSFSEAGDILGNLGFVVGLRGSSQRMLDCQGEQKDQFDCRRAGAQENFSILRADLSYTHRVLGWEFFARGDFQLSRLPLVSNEQFTAGGVDSVRGYLEGEAAGDSGWRLRTEIKTPSLFDMGAGSLRGVVFADGAMLKLQDPLAGQTGTFNLAGGGVGLRLKAYKNIQLSMDWARAMRAGPRTASGDERVHVRLNASF